MTAAPPPQKQSLWVMLGELDLSKMIAPLLWTIGIVGGMVWWVITRDSVNTLTASQVTTLTQRLDKVEGKQDDQAKTLNTIVTNQGVGTAKMDMHEKMLEQIQQDLRSLTQRQGH